MRPTIHTIITILIVAILSVGELSASASDVDAEKDQVVEVLFGYLKAISTTDFQKATTFVIPGHLDEVRTHTLPVLIEAREDLQNEGNPLLDQIFEGISPEEAGELSGAQVLARIDNAVTTLMPGLLDIAHLDNINLMAVDLVQDNQATVRYETLLYGEIKETTKHFRKIDGQWYMSLDGAPEELADIFKQLFITRPSDERNR